MFYPTRYEFVSAIRLNNIAGVTACQAQDFDITEEGHWLLFVHKVTKFATKVPLSNIAYLLGTYSAPVVPLKPKTHGKA